MGVRTWHVDLIIQLNQYDEVGLFCPTGVLLCCSCGVPDLTYMLQHCDASTA